MSNDETLIRTLLDGFVSHDDNGLPRKTYPEPGSKEELAGRVALARRLRSGSPLTKEQSELLADLFDAGPDLHPWNDRRIAFEQRYRGRRPQPMANTQIARHVWDRVRSSWGVEQAVNDAMTKYHLSREQVYNVWGRYRPIFEEWREPFDQVQSNP
jgi:hypothetical protein